MGWTDLAGRIQTAGQTLFGETVTFTPAATSTPETVTGIFDAEHDYQEIAGDSVIETSRPRLIVREAALSAPPVRTDAITVRSTNYTVIEVMPDGQGDIELVLEKA
jgi:hypothetical protein